MASGLVVDACILNVLNSYFVGNTFKMMLLTAAGVAAGVSARGSWATRADVTGEIAAGGGYTAGGAAITITVSNSTSLHQGLITLANVVWTSSTIVARGGAIYQSLGGLASADKLCFLIDAGTDQTSDGGLFTMTAASALILQL